MHKRNFDRSKFKVTRDISLTISGWLLVDTVTARSITAVNKTAAQNCGYKLTKTPYPSNYIQTVDASFTARRYEGSKNKKVIPIT